MRSSRLHSLSASFCAHSGDLSESLGVRPVLKPAGLKSWVIWIIKTIHLTNGASGHVRPDLGSHALFRWAWMIQWLWRCDFVLSVRPRVRKTAFKASGCKTRACNISILLCLVLYKKGEIGEGAVVGTFFFITALISNSKEIFMGMYGIYYSRSSEMKSCSQPV